MLKVVEGSGRVLFYDLSLYFYLGTEGNYEYHQLKYPFFLPRFYFEPRLYEAGVTKTRSRHFRNCTVAALRTPSRKFRRVINCVTERQAEWLTLLLRIPEVHSSSLGLESGYRD